MRHVLATPGLEYFHTTYLFYPFGTTIADHPHTALPALVAATALRPLSIVAAQNVLLLAYAFANMAAMYALALTILSSTNDAGTAEPAEDHVIGRFREPDVERRRRAAILAAVIFGLSPYLAVHLLGHFDLVAAWVLPAFALALRRAVHQGSNRAAIAAGLILTATAYIAYYYVVYLCLFTVVYLLAWSLRLDTGDWAPPARRLRLLFLLGAVAFASLAAVVVLEGGIAVAVGTHTLSARTPQNALTLFWICALGWTASTWRPRLRVRWTDAPAASRALAVLTRVVVTFVIGAAPLFWQAARLIARGEYVTPFYGWRSAPRGIDVLAPLLGHPLHPLFHAFSARAYAAVHADYVEAIAWIGVVPLVLLLLTRGRGDDRDQARIWRVVGLVFLVWALGPFLLVGGFDTGLKLPVILARFVPLVANARMPGRAMVVVFMALAVLVGLGMSAASRGTGRLRAASLQWLVIALVAFEYWDAPIRLTSLDSPAVYRALAAAAPGPVCEVPFGIGDGLSEGVGSQDRRVLFYATQHAHPLAGGYIGRMPAGAAQRYTAMPVAGALLQLSDGKVPVPSVGLADAPLPCRYLVVHRPATSGALLTYVEGLPADRIASDESRDLYRLR